MLLRYNYLSEHRNINPYRADNELTCCATIGLQSIMCLHLKPNNITPLLSSWKLQTRIWVRLNSWLQSKLE